MYDIRAQRKHLRMTQTEFWERLGVTQSAGSRYESGAEMPRPTQELYRLVYVEHIELENINRIDMAIAQLIKTEHPDLYQSIARGVTYLRNKRTP